MNYEKIAREISDRIGLDVYEINAGFDFESTVEHYTRIAKEENMTYEELEKTLRESMDQ